MKPESCDKCSKPAVVHEVVVKNGIKSEVHLCEQHAQQAGVELPAGQPVQQLLTQFVISQGTRRTKRSTKSCPNCGLAFSQFRHSGVLGCPECYDAFEQQLSPIIERAQGGATHHCGKAPVKCEHTLDRKRQIQQIVRELDRAVAAEQYERAAELRDRLLSLENESENGDSEPGRRTSASSSEHEWSS